MLFDCTMIFVAGGVFWFPRLVFMVLVLRVSCMVRGCLVSGFGWWFGGLCLLLVGCFGFVFY